MLLRTRIAAALVVTGLAAAPAAAQNAAVAAASKAMGVDSLTSITYSGTARNGAFGQSKAIGEPMGPVNVTQITKYTRAITFAPAGDPTALVSRATGPTQPQRFRVLRRRNQACSTRTSAAPRWQPTGARR
jgi:hypothetical protein